MTRHKSKEVVKHYRKMLQKNYSLAEIDQDIFSKFYQHWQHKKIKKSFGFFVILAGFLFLLFSSWPFFKFLFYQCFVKPYDFFAPIPDEQVLKFVSSNQDYDDLAGLMPNYQEVLIIEDQLNFNNLNNWFVKDVFQISSSEAKKNQNYFLEIPKLKIYKAKINFGDVNLNDGLIQYSGTSDPGSLGAPIIFGHSALRQFFNPKENNPHRYSSIFSTIMTLEKGDQIFLIKDGIRYEYRVSFKENIKPNDEYILSQRYDMKYLKLVTCTPEGTYLMRGIISAELVDQ